MTCTRSLITSRKTVRRLLGGWSRSSSLRSRILLGHLLGYYRHTLGERLGRRAASRAGWEGFVEWRRSPRIWTAYVRLASDPTFYPLPTSSAATSELREIFAQRSAAWTD